MIVWVYIPISNVLKTYCSFPILGVLIHAIDWAPWKESYDQPVRERLRNPICYFLFLKGSLFLISSWKTGTSRAARSSQD